MSRDAVTEHVSLAEANARRRKKMGTNDQDQSKQGLFNKFNVTRTDGRSAPGEKHEHCEYFVLDLTHDPHAKAAVEAYADSCEGEYPLLASDLRQKAALIPEA